MKQDLYHKFMMYAQTFRYFKAKNQDERNKIPARTEWGWEFQVFAETHS